MYEVIDEFYEDYLQRTNVTKPDCEDVQKEPSAKDDMKFLKLLKFKNEEETKCINRLE